MSALFLPIFKRNGDENTLCHLKMSNVNEPGLILLYTWTRLFKRRLNPNLRLNRRNFRLDFRPRLVLLPEKKLALT